MLTPTKDPVLVNWIMQKAFADSSLDCTATLARANAHAFYGEHGVVIFGANDNATYSLTLAVTEDGQGKWAVDFLRAAVAWMFLFTDAIQLNGIMVKDSKRTGKIGALIPGAKFTDDSSGARVAVFTLGRWAKAIGVTTAVAVLRASGQASKAAKLAAQAVEP